MKRRYVEEITVYDITFATGYKDGSIPEFQNDADNVDEQLENYFVNNRYNQDSLPDVNSTNGLSAQDISNVFNYKSYSNAEEAKNAVLADTYVSWINDNAESVNYTWASGKLKVDIMFADQTAYDTWLTGVKSGTKGDWKFTGPVVATVTN